MKRSIASKFELDLSVRVDYKLAIDFAIKNGCLAVVVPPDLVAPMMAHRSTLQSSYKIISQIDFPNGKNFAIDKLSRMNSDTYAADGFDILATPGKTLAEQTNEIKLILQILRQVNRLAEIRIVIDIYKRPAREIMTLLQALKSNPVTMIRTGVSTTADINIDKHMASLALIRKFVPTPVKICGNINLETIMKLKNNVFDVTLEQAQSIVKEIEEMEKSNVRTNT